MKILLLASTLGLTLLANTAVAAVSSEESSVWRNTEANTIVASDDVKTNSWKRTGFSTIDKAETETNTPNNYRRIRF